MEPCKTLNLFWDYPPIKVIILLTPKYQLINCKIAKIMYQYLGGS